MLGSVRPSLLVLAAGMGSRYGGLKQMDPMGPNGETVLDYAVFDAIRAGFGKVVFIIRPEFADDFKAKVAAKFKDKIKVEYAFQSLSDLPEGFSVPEGRSKPWGTSHAVLAARELIKEPFAVINADDFYGKDGFLQMAKGLRSLSDKDQTAEYLIVAYRLENTLSDHGSVNRGVCTVADALLQDVEEHTKIAKQEDGRCFGTNLAGERVEIDLDSLVSMNLWGFTPELMEYLQRYFIQFLEQRGGEMKSECYLPSVVDALIKDKKAVCRVISSDSHWFGVTYPKDKHYVVESIAHLIEQGEYPSKLWP